MLCWLVQMTSLSFFNQNFSNLETAVIYKVKAALSLIHTDLHNEFKA